MAKVVVRSKRARNTSGTIDDGAASVPPPPTTASQFWLLKSEPDTFSIAQLESKQRSSWDGVRNYGARNHMKQMHLGDLCLFYHSNSRPSGVVGIARVVKLAYPDHTAMDEVSPYFDRKAFSSKNNPWEMVDVEFVERFPKVLSLDDMRSQSALSGMVLFKQSRLSVQPVSAKEYDCIVQLARKK